MIQKFEKMDESILKKIYFPKSPDSCIIDLEYISTESSIDSLKSEVMSKNMCNRLQKNIDALDSKIYSGKKSLEEI